MTRTLWAVMDFTPWDRLITNGQPTASPAPGCCALIPVFETEQQAREWAGADAAVEPLLLSEADP
jgi:hypothetical protein